MSPEQRTPAELESEAFAKIVGESQAIRAVLSRAAGLLQHADTPALIVGEVGTGKELLANAIHNAGPRGGAAFVPVNCSLLPADLIETELLSHERRTRDDSHAAKPGLFEVANGGTLFLDEIGSLPVEVQAKLLHVLEDRQGRREDGTQSRSVDVRIMAATTEDLGAALQNGVFHEDLFFRLSETVLRLPPLRDRGDDVSLIAERLVADLAAHHRLPTPPITPEIRRALSGYRWPGNVRELRNALELALLLSPPGKLELAELVPQRGRVGRASGPLPFPASLDEIAAAAARTTLQRCGGNRSEAARRLKISRRRLRRLLDSAPATAQRS